jgi:predicted nucleic acid-binding protein
VNDQYIVDTDIWIDFLRGRSQAEDFINGLEIRPFLSAITVAELYARQYRKSHGTGLPDAVVAATANLEDVVLATLNRKHFPMLTNVLVPYVKP